MDAERLLLSYPALGFVRLLQRRWPGTSLLQANLVFVITCAALLLAGSMAERTLVLPGNAFGLLEHPAIWIFLAGHAILPPMLQIALKRFASMADSGIFERNSSPKSSIILLRRDLGRRPAYSRSLYSGLTMVGLAAWIWNSYQNQLPYELLGTDFWDSRLHPIGYGLTRVYKLYVWLSLIPMILHVQFLLVRRADQLLRRLSTRGYLRLQPFHPDGSGGMSVIVRSVVTPLVPALLLGAALNLAVIIVHGKADPTTVGASVAFLAALLVFYAVPAKALRDLIATEKRRQLEKIAETQETLYRSLLEVDMQASLPHAAPKLTLLLDLARRVDEVALWPEASRMARAALLYAASPVVGLIVTEALSRTKEWIF